MLRLKLFSFVVLILYCFYFILLLSCFIHHFIFRIFIALCYFIFIIYYLIFSGGLKAHSPRPILLLGGPPLKPKIEAQNPIVKHQSRPISTGCRFRLKPDNEQSPVFASSITKATAKRPNQTLPSSNASGEPNNILSFVHAKLSPTSYSNIPSYRA